MANELTFAGDPATESGLTVVARLYSQSGATWSQLGSDVSMTESGTLAIYVASMPSASAGSYLTRFFNGATLLKQDVLYWDGSADITLQTISSRILTSQNVRDAMKLAHTDGTISIDSKITNIPAIRGI